MEQNFQPRMKRKDFEDIHDDFADFSFSSPATKIRRLDAEVPPMALVDEEPEVAAAAFEQSQRLPEQSFHQSGGLRIEELPNLEENEERAIVLFKPNITSPIAHSPSSFSVSLDPRFISGLKGTVLRPSQDSSWNWRVTNEDVAAEEEEIDRCSSSKNGCQAVVPWLPPPFPSTNSDGSHQLDSNEMTDTEEMGEAAAMDVEDSTSIQQSSTNEGGGSVLLNQGLPQWQQQQHCTIMQLPQNTTTPIVWYR